MPSNPAAALDATSSLPLFHSLTHLTYLTFTSLRIREIMTLDGGLERLVRLLHAFCFSPPPPENLAVLYGLSPPTARPARPPPTLNLAVFDKHTVYRFSLAFQCRVNIGVRGSEDIRGRVVQAGTLEEWNSSRPARLGRPPATNAAHAGHGTIRASHRRTFHRSPDTSQPNTEDDGDVDMDRAPPSPTPGPRARCAVGIVSDVPPAAPLDTPDAHVIINDTGMGVEDGIVSLEPNDDFAMGAPPGGRHDAARWDDSRAGMGGAGADATPRAGPMDLPLAGATPMRRDTGVTLAPATARPTRHNTAMPAATTAVPIHTHAHVAAPRHRDEGPYRDEDVLLSMQLLTCGSPGPPPLRRPRTTSAPRVRPHALATEVHPAQVPCRDSNTTQARLAHDALHSQTPRLVPLLRLRLRVECVLPRERSSYTTAASANSTTATVGNPIKKFKAALSSESRVRSTATPMRPRPISTSLAPRFVAHAVDESKTKDTWDT
ncbi:hypothetical protein HWV62_39179 [Athelia sp. TMB]|nr:hypothetical protein HWV62_39179 [Athelia sp. TMB]